MRLLLAAAALALSSPAHARVAPSRVLPGLIIDDRGRPEERRLLETALGRLKSSPTARRMEERRRRLPPVTISFGVWGSSDTPDFGDGDYGKWYQASSRVVVYEGLISTRPFSETVAHELYGHGTITREAEAAGAGDVGWLAENEAFSLAVGRVVALELGEDCDLDQDIEVLGVSTAAYFARSLFTDSPTRLSLSLAEARDPRAAVKARLAELDRRRLSLKVTLEGDKIWRWDMEHFEKVHGAPASDFAERRADLEVWESTVVAGRRDLLDKAEPHLKTVLEWFDEPEGRVWVASMTAVSRTAYAAKLEDEFVALGRRLGELRRAAKPAAASEPAAAPAGPPGKSWDEIRDMTEADRREHPDHWKTAPTAPDEVPWEL